MDENSSINRENQVVKRKPSSRSGYGNNNTGRNRLGSAKKQSVRNTISIHTTTVTRNTYMKELTSRNSQALPVMPWEDFKTVDVTNNKIITDKRSQSAKACRRKENSNDIDSIDGVKVVDRWVNNDANGNCKLPRKTRPAFNTSSTITDSSKFIGSATVTKRKLSNDVPKAITTTRKSVSSSSIRRSNTADSKSSIERSGETTSKIKLLEERLNMSQNIMKKLYHRNVELEKEN